MTNLNPEIRAGILVEALPYIQEYTGKIIVVKYGGNAMINEELKQAVIRDIVLLNLVGVRVVLVHGGGPEISELLKKTGKESKFVKGLRYTDEEVMDAVQMVLCGKVNKNLVGLLDKAGGKGVGLSGMDGGLFQAVRLTDPDGTDYGYVGDIVKVNEKIVLDLLEKGYIPVVSSVAAGLDDDTNYNINADTAAEKLAVALKAKKLILLTDVRGLMRDPKDDSTLIPKLKVSEVPALIREGVITGGMIPKVDCCVEAVRQGVERANIQDGRVPHSILIELLSQDGVGTMFC
jgi:acetylglutamate kinase